MNKYKLLLSNELVHLHVIDFGGRKIKYDIEKGHSPKNECPCFLLK